MHGPSAPPAPARVAGCYVLEPTRADTRGFFRGRPYFRLSADSVRRDPGALDTYRASFAEGVPEYGAAVRVAARR